MTWCVVNINLLQRLIKYLNKYANKRPILTEFRFDVFYCTIISNPPHIYGKKTIYSINSLKT